MESTVHRCFPLLAAGLLPSAATAPRIVAPNKATSPLKTRVGGSRGCPSGRSSRRRLRSHGIATGCRRYAYRTALGRSSWPNRDPLGEPGFELLLRRKPSIRGSGANLYLFVRNSPISTVDFLGLDAFPVPPGGFPTGPKNPCPCGEAAAQIAAVGPLDANTARRLANEALAAARASGLPGLHNGQADAFRHCFWSCRMAQEIGAGQAKDVGDTHERCNKNPAGEEAMDQANNATGRGFGTPGADCNAQCLQAARDGTLQTSPSGTPPANPY